jgi:hypothetical protein
MSVGDFTAILVEKDHIRVTGTSIGPRKKKYDQIDKKPVFTFNVSKLKKKDIIVKYEPFKLYLKLRVYF